MKTLPRIIVLATLLTISGCSSIEEVSILSVKLTPTGGDIEDIPYGSSATDQSKSFGFTGSATGAWLRVIGGTAAE